MTATVFRLVDDNVMEVAPSMSLADSDYYNDREFAEAFWTHWKLDKNL